MYSVFVVWNEGDRPIIKAYHFPDREGIDALLDDMVEHSHGDDCAWFHTETEARDWAARC